MRSIRGAVNRAARAMQSQPVDLVTAELRTDLESGIVNLALGGTNRRSALRAANKANWSAATGRSIVGQAYGIIGQ